MFIRMQPVFDMVCPTVDKGRKNFLSYNYVLYRCFHILGLRYMLPDMQLLKGREKLLLQDRIFEKIAERLSWEFVDIEQLVQEVKREEVERLAAIDQQINNS